MDVASSWALADIYWKNFGCRGRLRVSLGSLKDSHVTKGGCSGGIAWSNIRFSRVTLHEALRGPNSRLPAILSASGATLKMQVGCKTAQWRDGSLFIHGIDIERDLDGVSRRRISDISFLGELPVGGRMRVVSRVFWDRYRCCKPSFRQAA